MIHHLHLFLFLVFFSLSSTGLKAQHFQKVTDPENDLAQHGPGAGAYTGVCWMDYNGDGFSDCFINSNNLYRNEGNGSFTKVDFSGTNPGLGNGSSWGDYDNDGDLDVFIAASPSHLYRNDGDDSFSKVDYFEQIPSFRGWSAAWGDYDKDGWLDLIVTHPAGFLGPSQENWLFRSQGDGTFAQVTSGDPVTGLAAYTVGSWTDFDRDGDLDLFIGSGEVNLPSKDHIYLNFINNIGNPALGRRQLGPLFGDRDGQNWNFIDFDNDRDLDGFVTNYLPQVPNQLYRNDEDGYQLLTAADAGPIAGQTGTGLSNCWGDFDNDGYIDCVVTIEDDQTRYYRNLGDGTFEEQPTTFSVVGYTRGASAADYDNDGDLDLFVSSADTGGLGLYQNLGNANHWIQLDLEGTSSNRDAIGTRLELLATLDGRAQWQIREVNAQNSFAGHNDLRIHFGLGDAASIDSLIVYWPSGLIQSFAGLESNQICNLVEGQGSDCKTLTGLSELGARGAIFRVFPTILDSGEGLLQARIRWPVSESIALVLLDSSGRPWLSKRFSLQADSERRIELELPPSPTGHYMIVVRGATLQRARSLIIR